MGKVLGLDIGVSSVGWSLIDSSNGRILDLGVRLFSAANAENNETRRLARSSRRVTRRKKLRLKDIGKLLREAGFCPLGKDYNPYELRVMGLDGKLEKDQVYIALYHLAKRRGVSYLEDADVESFANANDSLKENLKDLKVKFPGEIQLDRLNQYGKVRGLIELEDRILMNVFPTGSYEDEARAILSNQAKYYGEIDQDFIESYIEIMTRKREFYQGPGNEKSRTDYGIYKEDGRTLRSLFDELIGNCSIYLDEMRAPTGSYTAEEFNLLNDLNNLKIAGRKLEPEEKQKIVDEIFNVKTKSCSSKKVISIIKDVCKLENNLDIKGYRTDKSGNPEFHTMEANRNIKRFIGENDFSFSYEDLDVNILNKFAEVLNKSYDMGLMIKLAGEELKFLNDEDIRLLYRYRQENKALYSRWHSFSLKLMEEIRSELYEEPKNQMQILSEKVLSRKNTEVFQKYKYIPVDIMEEDIYNSVVRKSLRESIKIVNAILKNNDDLEVIVVEMPRDSNEENAKKKIVKMQEDNKKEKKKALEKLNKDYSENITEDYALAKNLLNKIRFWYQQDGKCIYSGKTIGYRDLIDSNLVEIDHIIPKSISFDDSINNKVLVLAAANQIKGQRSPFGAFYNSEPYNYEDIRSRAEKLYNNKKISKTKFDLLSFEENIYDPEVRRRFKNRNLVDTRYSTRAVLSRINDYIRVKELDMEAHTVTGKFTGTIRKRWGLLKDRDISFAHHAIDASIVAAAYTMGISNKTIQNPFEIKDNEDFDRKVLSEPWPNFIGYLHKLDKSPDMIKYSHKIDGKVNRQLSDLQMVSTREIEGKYIQVKTYKDIYDNDTAKSLISKIKKDLEGPVEESQILMRRHDPGSFSKLIKIIESYQGEKPNPFEAYRRENGYIRKYTRKKDKEDKMPAIKNVKYFYRAVNRGIELETSSKDRKVYLMSIKPFRTDIYYSSLKEDYRFIDLDYKDLNYDKGEYIIDRDYYLDKKDEFKIDDSYEFIFSLRENDILSIKYKEDAVEYFYRFLSNSNNKRKLIEVKKIHRENKNKERIYKTIGNKVEKFKKYHTDILGNIYEGNIESLTWKF